MAAFSIKTSTVSAHSVVASLTGDMTQDNFDSLEGEFNSLLEAGIIGVVLDLTGVGSLTSAGIGAIINLGDTLRKRNGRLHTVLPGQESTAIITMLGLDDALGLTPSVEEGKRKVVNLK